MFLNAINPDVFGDVHADAPEMLLSGEIKQRLIGPVASSLFYSGATAT